MFSAWNSTKSIEINKYKLPFKALFKKTTKKTNKPCFCDGLAVVVSQMVYTTWIVVYRMSSERLTRNSDYWPMQRGQRWLPWSDSQWVISGQNHFHCNGPVARQSLSDWVSSFLFHPRQTPREWVRGGPVRRPAGDKVTAALLVVWATVFTSRSPQNHQTGSCICNLLGMF